MDPAELDRILSGLPIVHDSNLVLGYDHKDDAAVYRLPSGEHIVQTVDFFTPVVDDPYDYGAIAAANSLSDIYAMNGTPLFALNICCFPRKQSFELWREVLRGGTEKAAEAGIAVVGGHTVDDAEPKYGMVVTGIVNPANMWTNEGAQVGDALVLTKPLGMGIITTALKNETITSDDAREAIEQMKQLNRTAAQTLSQHDVHACTDITGNGFLGHASEIADASGIGMEFSFSRIPILNLARKLGKTGTFPGGTFSNRKYFEAGVDIDQSIDEGLSWLLFDAQTSGGLLAALAPNQAGDALAALHKAGLPNSDIVGCVTAGRRLRVKP